MVMAALCATSQPGYAAGELQLDPVAATHAAPEGKAREARGVLRAVDQAVLSSELNAKITEMPFREGEAFNKGDLLVKFDCSAYQAQLSASQAAMRAAQQEVSQNRQLAAMKSVGRNAVALSEARLAQAAAESQVYQIQTSRCRVIAPFSGQVVSRKAQVSEYLAQGAPLLEIVDNRHLEINLLVPSSWLASLKPKQTFTFTPDETGTELQAEIVRVGARIDESSQTLVLIGRVTQADSGLIAGMSGSARFTDPQ
ncbi:efflux RND transporter periplasmic adaptor subunit [Erwinia sp. J316]|uniref:Efflux RND transporter periplasmic adaptor subunit n=2 Tax=Erwinia sorbitola TaxID=2681984 RepID=A0A6I6EZQ9_9GAMM|nr:efflux RND transporter periplasmic adaptor subunit [Erwinia sorbitola]QGU89673.1 efflux RND transporter periplasmic adaptor subunit [Erwinia sorbitola]